MKPYFAKYINDCKIRFWDALIALFAICTLRDIEEAILNHRQILDNPNNEWRTLITVFFHYNSFWILVFGLLVLLVYSLTWRQKTIRETLAISLFATPIIFLAPILNLILGDNTGIAYPHNPLNLINILPHFINPNYKIQGVTIGMRWEIVFAGIGGFLYVYFVTRKVWKSILCFIGIFTLILLIGSLAPILGQLYENGFSFSNDFRLYDSILFHKGSILETFSQRVSLLYIFLCIIISIVIICFYDKKMVKNLLSNIRITRTLHYVILFFGGLLTAIACCHIHIDEFNIEHSHCLIEELVNPFDYFGIFMGVISLFFAFESAVIFNDVYDINIDKMSDINRPLVNGSISLKRYKTVGLLCLLAAISIAFCINEAFTFLIISFTLLSCLYSFPPFRLRKSLFFSCLILSLEALISFACGASIFVQSAVFMVIPDKLTISLLVAYFIVIPIKDLKDYEGDKENQIHTLITLFGKKTGTIITVIQICLVIVILPLILGINNMLWFAIAIVVLFIIINISNKKNKLNTIGFECVVFSLYFIYLILLFYYTTKILLC